MPCDVPTESDAHLTVTWSLRAGTEWAPAGHVVACDQAQLRAPSRSKAPVEDAGGSGLGKVLVSKPVLSIFRAPVDNDGYKLMPELGERHGIGGTCMRAWQEAGIDVGVADDFVQHDHQAHMADGSETHHHVVDVPESLNDLGRVGITFELGRGFDRIRWFGRGQLENYPDRNRGAMIGTWEGGIDDAPYLVAWIGHPEILQKQAGKKD